MATITKSQPTKALEAIKNGDGHAVVDCKMLSHLIEMWESDIMPTASFLSLVKRLKSTIDWTDGVGSMTLEMGGIRLSIHGTESEMVENMERMENSIRDIKTDISKAKALSRGLLWYACEVGLEGKGYAKKKNGRDW